MSNVVEPLTIETEIPVSNLATLEDAISRLNKRARRLHLPEIKLMHGVKRIEQIRNEMTGEVTRVREWQAIRVTGQTPRLNGWQFVATIQHAGEAGNILRVLPDITDDLPTRFRTAEPGNCDHCHMLRNRKDTYVVHNPSTDVYAQVGSNCLAAYTGADSVESAIAIAEMVAGLGVAISEAEDGDYNPGQRDPTTAIATYLPYVVEAIRQYGWLSRGKARDTGGAATADVADTRMRDHAAGRKTSDRNPAANWVPSEASIADAARYLTLARETLEIMADDTRSDYEHNLYIVIASDFITNRMMGIAASVVPYAQRIESERARAQLCEKTNANGYYGTVGSKFSTPATITSVRTYEGSYGASYIYSFATDDGHTLTWFASNEQKQRTGAHVTVSGTVKDHKEYRGEYQSIVTRCKLA